MALYHSTKSSVPFRYRNILFTAVRCASVGSELNLETIPTAWAMSGRVALAACRRLPWIDSELHPLSCCGRHP